MRVFSGKDPSSCVKSAPGTTAKMKVFALKGILGNFPRGEGEINPQNQRFCAGQTQPEFLRFLKNRAVFKKRENSG